MRRVNDWQGKLYRKWVIECRENGCGALDEIGTHNQSFTATEAVAEARRRDWRYVPRKGWYCPYHAKER